MARSTRQTLVGVLAFVLLASSVAAQVASGRSARGPARAPQGAFSQSRGGFVGFERIRQPGSLMPHKFNFGGGVAPFIHPTLVSVHSLPVVAPHAAFVPVIDPPIVGDPHRQPAPQPPPPQPQPIIIFVPTPAAPPAPTPRAESRAPRPPVPVRVPERPQGPGGIRFSIQPPEAKVFLDDRLIGLGGELNRRPEATEVRSGIHVLEIVHPGLEKGRILFGVEPRREVTVVVDLEASNARRRASVEESGTLVANSG